MERIVLANYRNGTLRMSDVTLSEALRFAYDLVTDDQVSGPDWIKSRGTRYEVAAKTAGDVPLAQARVLMQKLLADRLKVVIRKEAKRISDDVTKRVSSALESAVEKTLHRFNVPTHKELQKLTSKVDTLGAKIDSMRRTKSPARAKAAGRVKTARKPAPKRARARR